MFFPIYICLQFVLLVANANHNGYGYGYGSGRHAHKLAHSAHCLKRVVQARVLMFKANDNPSHAPLEPIGVVDMSENAHGITTLNGTLNNLSPGDHGFHFHQFGDISQACMGAGAHFNPFNVSHGAQDAPVRHVGDLGNLVANAYGTAVVDIRDHLVKLNGLCSVVGRALVVHEKRDDLGLVGNEESLKTGNSGKRVGCGVVAITKEL